MSAIESLVKQYLATFNETDAARRRSLIEQVYTDDAGYSDPLGAVTGRAAIDGFIATVQQHYPGIVFTLAGSVDAHHNQARFTWHAGPPGAKEPAAIGFDVVVTENGRVRQVYGFLDKAPG